MSPFFPQKSFSMSEEEMGKIALAFLKLMMKEDGYRISQGLTTEVSETAEKCGIPYDRVLMFMEIMVRESLDDALNTPPVVTESKDYPASPE